MLFLEKYLWVLHTTQTMDKGSQSVSEGSVLVNNTYNSFMITKAGHDMIWEINPGKNSKHIPIL